MSSKEISRRARAGLRIWLALLLMSLASACGDDTRPTEQDYQDMIEVFGGRTQTNEQEPDYGPPITNSFYLIMRDGVRIAVDVHLPQKIASDQAQELAPAILRPTRYWRAVDLRGPLKRLRGPSLFREFFCRSGYVVVDVDVRGSGASFGLQPHPWSSDEVLDYGEVMDWIVAQPWSNGRIAASGASYVGTAAEFSSILGHPALKAVLPRFSLYDVYTDIVFPGGVFNEWFVRRWGALNNDLDANRLPEESSFLARLAARGVAPVESDGAEPSGCQLLAEAVAGHVGNLDIYAASRGVTYRDDVADEAGTDVDGFSPHTYLGEAQRNGVAVYAWGGWFDGAYAASLLHRFASQDGPRRAVIGPWNHGGGKHISPYQDQDDNTDPSPLVQLMEQRRFLDYWLRDRGDMPTLEIVYYTMGEETWKRSPVWPPEGASMRALRLGPDHGLAWSETERSGADEYMVDFTAGSGPLNRWRTQLSRSDVAYPDRAESDRKLLVYESVPLPADLEITGTPVADLWITSTATDGHFFAYLEDVAPDGTVRYLSEGMLRALHRKISDEVPPYVLDGPYHTFLRADGELLTPGEPARLRFALLPLSALVRQGHRIRLAIAGHDADQFARLPDAEAPVIRVLWGGVHASRLELPIIPR
ncbi:MAG: CocE/NonD family hydrolase [Desulfocurvibacter africanus]